MSRKVVRIAVSTVAFALACVAAGVAYGSSSNDPTGENSTFIATADPDTPVVLVILDEFPTATLLEENQTINSQRFPNFAAFASKSTWYRDHTAAGDYTAWAVPPILTGNHVDERTLPTNRAQPNNIFNLLGPGRTVHAMEEVTELCSKKYCPDGHQGEALGEPNAGEFVKDKFKLLDMKAVGRWIDSIPSGKRSLSVIHLPLPHQPQRFLPNGQTYPGGPVFFTIPRDRNDWTVSDAGTALIQQRHLLQTAFADRVVGQIFEKVKSNGDWDKSMIVVTADHGFNFDTRYDRRDVEPGNIAATVNPPLMIKYPGQSTGVVSDESTQGIDVTPTIAKQLGKDQHYAMDGVPIDQIPANREMTVNKDNLAEITITADDIRRERPGVIAAETRRVGNGGLWKLGPVSGIIGTNPVRRNAVAGARVEFDFPRRLADFTPGQGKVPSLVSGELTGVGPNEVVALAVNGIITSTSRTFRWNGAMRFGSMVPPTALKRGENRTRLYLVASRERLRPIR